MTLKREQSEELPNNNEKILQHYVEKMGDLIAVSDEGVSEDNLFTSACLHRPSSTWHEVQ